MFGKWFGKQSKQVSFLVCESENSSPELSRVMDWLKQEGFEIIDESWNVVGSQELSSYVISNGSVQATLLLETYQGATLHTTEENAYIFKEIRLST